MNSQDEAAKNALMQLGGFDEFGRFTILYDPTSALAKENKMVYFEIITRCC